jgi:hypothetical protein
MSATKSMAKWVKTADSDKLSTMLMSLTLQRDCENNAMRRSSLDEQMRIVRTEQQKRANSGSGHS